MGAVHYTESDTSPRRELDLKILQDALAREAAGEAADIAAKEAKRAEVGADGCHARRHAGFVLCT